MTDRFEKKLNAGVALAGLVGAAACLAVSGSPALAGDDGATATAGGMRVYVDPSTGQVLKEPPQGAAGSLTITPAERNAFSTSHEGLVQTPAGVPGGGVRLDLKGRFQSSLMATVGPDGKPQIKHLGEAERAHDHE